MTQIPNATIARTRSSHRPLSPQLLAELARLAEIEVRLLELNRAYYEYEEVREPRKQRPVRTAAVRRCSSRSVRRQHILPRCGLAADGPPDTDPAQKPQNAANAQWRNCSLAHPPEACVNVAAKANTGAGASVEAYAQMARRRFQTPAPKRRGEWWTIRVRRDTFESGKHRRVFKRVRLAPATMSEREVRKIAAEYLRPLNQGLETIGSATNFQHYVEETYIPLVMPLLAKTTQDRYQGVLRNYLVPAFGQFCLRDQTTLALQRYFSQMAASTLSQESKDKIRDVLASVLGSAVRYGLLVNNPVEGVQLPPDKRGKRKKKPHITPEQFDELVNEIQEPYATMVYVAIYTGLRISELAALKWNDVGFDSITVDERYCRGDWSQPKSDASNATIGVDRCVIERIHRLKLLTVEVRAGRAIRKHKVVKSDGPDDLVFQSVRDASLFAITTSSPGSSNQLGASSASVS
jgi:hypothetical protein